MYANSINPRIIAIIRIIQHKSLFSPNTFKKTAPYFLQISDTMKNLIKRDKAEAEMKTSISTCINPAMIATILYGIGVKAFSAIATNATLFKFWIFSTEFVYPYKSNINFPTLSYKNAPNRKPSIPPKTEDSVHTIE